MKKLDKQTEKKILDKFKVEELEQRFELAQWYKPGGGDGPIQGRVGWRG